jgi:hypothetical protein
VSTKRHAPEAPLVSMIPTWHPPKLATRIFQGGPAAVGLAKLTNCTSIAPVADSAGRLLLNTQQLQHSGRGDDRERVASARQAAEALFPPKRQVTEQPVPDSVPPAEPSARKPRILRALPPAPVRGYASATARRAPIVSAAS